MNYSGSLHRRRDEAIILVNTDIKNEGKINFTKAHEFGHYYMKHPGTEFKCSASDMRLVDISEKRLEVEANQFASNFLMPEHMIRPIVFTSSFGFDTINYVRRHFQVSKIAAAFKLLEYTAEDCALINSINGVIKHVGLSQSLIGKVRLSNGGARVPDKSFASRIIQSSAQMQDFREIEASIWLTQGSKDYNVYENSRANRATDSIRTCLTLLYFTQK